VQAVTLSRAQCLELLAATHLGRAVVTVGAEHRPVIRPVNYLFDQSSQAVTFRCAAGTKLHALLRSASACFEIDDHDAEARTGWSVVVYGVSEPVVRPTDILRLERSGLDSLAPGSQPEWIRIRATTVTGMRIRAAAATDW
jgi:nitroimidazol reductase NimA-like FMN-containing flavoprotein (pyridoxamine 5'-phosphate oxidase superfamily)